MLTMNTFTLPSIAMIVTAFFCGSLPFSVWLGRLFLQRDVRRYGDGNPGTANVFRAGGRLLGVLVLMLDISKAAAPVGAAYFNLGMRGVPMFLVALAPMLGHIFSPFLGFKGGKAIATALGVWIGLTIWKASLPGVVFALLGIALLDNAGWVVLIALGGILGSLLIWNPDPLLLAVLGGQVILLAWTHRADLRRKAQLRARVMGFLKRNQR